MRKGIPAFIRSMPSGLVGQFVPGDSGSGPAPACAITLSGEGLGPFGLSPLDVDGQNVSITAAGGGTNYAAHSGLAGNPVDWAGKRGLQVQTTTLSSTAAQTQFARVRLSDFAQVVASYNVEGGFWSVSHVSGMTVFGVLDLTGLTDPLLPVVLAIDGATGDVSIYIDGVVACDKNTTPDTGTFAGLGGMFFEQSETLLISLYVADAADTFAATVTTAGEEFDPVVDATLLDYCGNDTVPDL